MNIAFRVLRVELLQLARDKRALFSAIVLPALLYPLFFWGSQKLEDVGEKTMAERAVTIAMDLSGLDEGTRDTFQEELVSRGDATVRTVDASGVQSLEDEEEQRLAALAIIETTVEEPEPSDPSAGSSAGSPAGEAGEPSGMRKSRGPDLLVIARSTGEIPDQRRAEFEFWYDVKSDDGREALSRAQGAAKAVESAQVIERRRVLLGGDPALALDPLPTDLASAEDASGAILGKLLPFVILLVLISGGAYAALAVFAGEREAGTLETLLVQPVPERSIAAGKFLAVFAAGMATLLVNLASLAGCVAFGLAGSQASGLESGGGLGFTRLLAVGIELPACLLLCAVLCLVCGRARTFREGQLLVFPVTLLVMVPTAIVLRPEASLTVMWALIPFAGSALALRDGFEGDLTLAMAALVTATHLGYTWIALTQLGRVLDAEKILGGGGDAKSEGHLRQASGRHAMRWGFALVMAMYLVAGSVQRWNLTAGLWFTFWIFLPLFAIGVAWLRPRAKGEGRRLLPALGLRLPHPLHVVAALLLAPALAQGAQYFFQWQMKLIPLPPGIDGSMDALAGFPEGVFWLLFFLSLSPGIFEELLFRGSLLESMKRDWKWPRVILWQGIYFGLIHLSIYRLAPTAILGALLAWLALRTRSVIPAMVLHITYNATVTLGARAQDPANQDEWLTARVFNADWFAYAPWAAVFGVGLLIAIPPLPKPDKG